MEHVVGEYCKIDNEHDIYVIEKNKQEYNKYNIDVLKNKSRGKSFIGGSAGM